jgi:hypothetical protein
MQNKELHNIYSSPDIIWTVTSKNMRFKTHVARTEIRNAFRLLNTRILREKPTSKAEALVVG